MTQQQIKSLLQIKSIDGVQSLNTINEYVDDHQQCAEVEINGINVEFLWYDELGFLCYYQESPAAAKKLINAIHASAIAMAENLEEDYDEELKQLIAPHI
jgi:hypothetical protein